MTFDNLQVCLFCKTFAKHHDLHPAINSKWKETHAFAILCTTLRAVVMQTMSSSPGLEGITSV